MYMYISVCINDTLTRESRLYFIIISHAPSPSPWCSAGSWFREPVPPGPTQLIPVQPLELNWTRTSFNGGDYTMIMSV